MLATSHIYFPLHSNIGYFDTAGRGEMSLEARIKQMVILAKEIVFEPGLLTLDVTENIVVPWWQPPHQISEKEIREHRKAAKEGEEFVFAIGAQPAKGVPAPDEAMRALGGGPLQKAYVAEYHLLAKESGLLEQSWVKFGLLMPDDMSDLKSSLQAEDRADFFDRDKPRLSDNGLLDDTLTKGLNKDLTVSAAIGMPIAVDALHAPMLTHKATRNAEITAEDYPGRQALSLWVPDFSNVPWNDVIALHDHDAIGAFREKLLDAEQEVADLDERDRADAIKDLGILELAKQLRKLQPSIKSVAVDVGFDAVASALSLGLASPLVTAARGASEIQESRSEWTAVYLHLIERSIRRDR